MLLSDSTTPAVAFKASGGSRDGLGQPLRRLISAFDRRFIVEKLSPHLLLGLFFELLGRYGTLHVNRGRRMSFGRVPAAPLFRFPLLSDV